jgi:glycosyltransferase involved in cell wall biosynthesis
LDLSIVVPVYNEEESLPALLAEIHEALDGQGLAFEVVCVDDGSADRSFAVLKEMAARDPALTVVRLRRNFGQTAAMQAGIDEARGEAVVLMDADLQNDPRDIPRMLAKLNEGYDLVAGWRADRKDTFINRRLPSILANALISRTTGVRLHDYGCTLKCMTRDVAKSLRLYGELHRFIPAIASWAGVSLFEMPVNHRARRFGKSKYGIGRTIRVLLDLLTIRFLQTYQVKPMQVFGLGGLVSGFLGFALCAWLTFEKLAWGRPLADRPLLLLGVLLIVVGIQLVSLGLVAEMLARTYHEAQGKPPYHVRVRLRGEGHRPARAAAAGGDPDAA